MEPWVVVKHLKKVYGKKEAVKDISFEIYPGQILALLGPNGAGKTTTVETVLGLRKKTAGKMIFFGEEVERPLRRHLKRIGATLQAEMFFPNLTVAENLSLFAHLYGSGDIEGVKERLDLADVWKVRYKKLSGGYKRRVALAVATLGDPDVVFLDEPTTGLDAHVRRNLYRYIAGLRDEGKGILLTTHYIEEAERLSDYVIIIDKGEVVARGTVEEIIKIAGLKTVVLIDGDRYEIEEDKEIKEILEKYENPEKITIQRPTLEDAFITLTGRKIDADLVPYKK